jgi:putative phosphoesterase
MLLAFISDIHSNFAALKAVLEKIDELKIKKVYCCGDVIGYASMPNQCIKEIIRRKIACVMGNHEAALIDKKFLVWFNYDAIKALIWNEENLNEKYKEWIKKLKERKIIKANKKILFAHSIESCFDYVFDASEEMIDYWLKKYDVDVIVIGHTHIPLIKKTKQGLLLNPGSVGQPRDGDNKASFALLNTATMEVEIVRVAYDIDEIARDIKQKGLPEFFAERLYKGI